LTINYNLNLPFWTSYNGIFDAFRLGLSSIISEILVSMIDDSKMNQLVGRFKNVVPNCTYNSYTISVIYSSSMTAKAQGCCERYSLGH
jgi:hypothetical protein